MYLTIVACVVLLLNGLFTVLLLSSINSRIDVMTESVEQLQDCEIKRLKEKVNILKDKIQ